MNRSIHVAVFFGLSILVGCGQRQGRHALILMDCSASLSAAERESSLWIAERLLRHGIRDGDSYTVAGLDGELAAEPFASGTRHTRSDSESREYDEQVRANMVRIREEVTKWSLDRRRRAQTCIMDSLLAAPRHFEKHGGIESGAVFIVSDMVEDCIHDGVRRSVCAPAGKGAEATFPAGGKQLLSGLEVTALLPYHASADGACGQSFESISRFWNYASARMGTPVHLYYPSDRPDLMDPSDE